MFERTKKFFLTGLLAVYVLAAMSGCSFRVQPSFDTESYIRIGKVVYPEAVSSLVLYSYQQVYEESFGFGGADSLWSQELTEDMTCWEYVRDQVSLEEFCCAAALSQMAAERGIVLDETDSELIRQAAQRYFQSISEENRFADSLSESDVEQVLTIYRLAQLCIEDMTKDISPVISDDEVRVIELYQITADTEEQAQTIWQRLQDGETVEYITGTAEFAHSTELVLRRGEAEELLEQEAFRLKTGEYSAPVLLEDGWSVLYCTNDYNSELSEQNRAEVYESRRTQAWLPEYQQWIEQAGVYLNQAGWEGQKPADDIGQQENLFSVFRETFPDA